MLDTFGQSGFRDEVRYLMGFNKGILERHGFVVLTREEAVARFGDHPPWLVPGIGPKTQERLLALGIRTLDQLAAADAETLTATFGPRQGPWLKTRGALRSVAWGIRVQAVWTSFKSLRR